MVNVQNFTRLRTNACNFTCLKSVARSVAIDIKLKTRGSRGCSFSSRKKWVLQAQATSSIVCNSCNSVCNSVKVATVAFYGKAGEMQLQHLGYISYTQWVLHAIPCLNVEKNWSTTPRNYLPDSRWSKREPERESHRANTLGSKFAQFSDVSVFYSGRSSAVCSTSLLLRHVVCCAHNSVEGFDFEVVIDPLLWSRVLAPHGLKPPRLFAPRMFALFAPASKRCFTPIQSGVRFDTKEVKQVTIYCDCSHLIPFVKRNTRIILHPRVARAAQRTNTAMEGAKNDTFA